MVWQVQQKNLLDLVTIAVAWACSAHLWQGTAQSFDLQ
jgi:hypothetical protein